MVIGMIRRFSALSGAVLAVSLCAAAAMAGGADAADRPDLSAYSCASIKRDFQPLPLRSFSRDELIVAARRHPKYEAGFVSYFNTGAQIDAVNEPVDLDGDGKEDTLIIRTFEHYKYPEDDHHEVFIFFSQPDVQKVLTQRLWPLLNTWHDPSPVDGSVKANERYVDFNWFPNYISTPPSPETRSPHPLTEFLSTRFGIPEIGVHDVSNAHVVIGRYRNDTLLLVKGYWNFTKKVPLGEFFVRMKPDRTFDLLCFDIFESGYRGYFPED